MRPLPPRVIDGVKDQDAPKDGSYVPKGVLSHEFHPPESVLICEFGNDLSYMASYWLVDKVWKLFIHDRDLYERLRDKFLQSAIVVVDYTDMNNLGIYIPKRKHVDGLAVLFKEGVDNLRELDREALEKHLVEINRMNIEDVLKTRYDRIGKL